jgi:hypothetical protein
MDSGYAAFSARRMGHRLSLAACSAVYSCAFLRLSPQAGVFRSIGWPDLHLSRLICFAVAGVVALVLAFIRP